LASLLNFATAYAADSPGMNCTLAGKELTLIKSQLDIIIEKYKIQIKQNFAPKMPTTPGQEIKINVDANNEFVKAIAKLAVAEATFEAINEMCKDGSLKASTDKISGGNKDEYQAKLIPKPTEPLTKP
jgi:hypothetical protein